jgi:hypothetical protein
MATVRTIGVFYWQLLNNKPDVFKHRHTPDEHDYTPDGAPMAAGLVYTTHAVWSMACSAEVEGSTLKQIAADIRQAFSAGGSLYNSAFRDEYVQTTGGVVAFDFGRMGAQALGFPAALSLTVRMSVKGSVGGSDTPWTVTIALRGGTRDAVFSSVMPADDAPGWVACMIAMFVPVGVPRAGNQASTQLLRRIDVVLRSLVGCKDRVDGSVASDT